MSVQYLPPTRELPPERIAAMRAELETFVTREEPATRWWRKRRTITGGLVIALIVATGGGTAAAYAYLHPRTVTNKGFARCYTEAVAVRSGISFPGTTIAQASGSGASGLVDNALDTCAALWRIGALRLGVPSIVPPVDDRRSYPVPALVGCTMRDGAAAVFPGTADTCDQLGLAPESPPAVRAAETAPGTAAPGTPSAGPAGSSP
jgi:hypothetical protein